MSRASLQYIELIRGDTFIYSGAVKSRTIDFSDWTGHCQIRTRAGLLLANVDLVWLLEPEEVEAAIQDMIDSVGNINSVADTEGMHFFRLRYAGETSEWAGDLEMDIEFRSPDYDSSNPNDLSLIHI